MNSHLTRKLRKRPGKICTSSEEDDQADNEGFEQQHADNLEPGQAPEIPLRSTIAHAASSSSERGIPMRAHETIQVDLDGETLEIGYEAILSNPDLLEAANQRRKLKKLPPLRLADFT